MQKWAWLKVNDTSLLIDWLIFQNVLTFLFQYGKPCRGFPVEIDARKILEYSLKKLELMKLISIFIVIFVDKINLVIF